MKVVIDIPENDYIWVCNMVKTDKRYSENTTIGTVYSSVAHGTVLPKEQGDLISRNALKEDFADMRDGYPIFSDTEMLSTKDIAKIIDNASTIIEGE